MPYARFQFGYDCARHGNLEVTITEIGGAGATGTAVLDDAYFVSVNAPTVTKLGNRGADITVDVGFVSAVAALQTALIAIVGAGVTVSFSWTTRKVTIARTSGGATSITLAFNAAAQQFFGFNATRTGALSYVGDAAVFDAIESFEGFTRFEPPHESTDDEIMSDLVMSDGGKTGIAASGVRVVWSGVLPLEPLARVRHRHRSLTDPATWETAFRTLRNVDPFWCEHDVFGTATQMVSHLNAQSAFDPTKLGGEYFAYSEIKLDATLDGYL